MIRYLLFLFAVCCLFACSACNNEQPTSSGKTDSTYGGNEKVEISFFDLKIDRDPLPIENIDSLAHTNFTVSDYVEKNRELDSLTRILQADTTLPIIRKNRELLEIARERERIDANATAIMVSICGPDDDLIDIENFRGAPPIDSGFVTLRAKPVGLICWNNNFGNAFTGPNDSPGKVMGKHWGSGFLISDDLFLTAGHCFETRAITPVKNGVSIIPDSMVKYMNVVFNYQLVRGSTTIHSDTMVFAIEKLVEFEKGGLDFALIKLNKNNGRLAGSIFSHLETVPKTHVLQNGADLCIIQHANGEQKKVGCGRLASFDAEKVYYDEIDTDLGSSGSPVIDFRSGAVIGVHSDGMCTRTSGVNFATSILAIKRISNFIK